MKTMQRQTTIYNFIEQTFGRCMLNTSPKLGTYTPSPSNLSSAGVLSLFLRYLSCLDAFSTYDLLRSCPAYLV